MTANEARKEALLEDISAAYNYAKNHDDPRFLGCRELSLAITKLEEALMWTEKIRPGRVG